LSYKATLARGFAVIRDNAGGAVQSRSQAEAGALWQVEFQDGPVEVRVEDGGTPTASSDSEPDAALSAKGGKRAKNPKAKNPGPKVEQGSLF